jgi:hypothetical protein
LSISPAAVGVLDLATRASVGMDSVHAKLKNAPDLILALSNDISDLRLMLSLFIEVQQNFAKLQLARSAKLHAGIDSQLYGHTSPS